MKKYDSNTNYFYSKLGIKICDDIRSFIHYCSLPFDLTGCFGSWRGTEFREGCWHELKNGCWIDGREWVWRDVGRVGEGCWVESLRVRCWVRFYFWCLLMIWRRGWWVKCWNLRMIPRFSGGWTLRGIKRWCREIWINWCSGLRGGRWSLMWTSVKLCIWKR